MKSYKRMILMGLLVLLVIASGVWLTRFIQQQPASMQQPEAVRGTIDLTNWQFETDGMVSLQGEWEFYWERFLDAEDFNEQPLPPPLWAKVPNVWTEYDTGGEPLPGFGYATYRLHVKAADNPGLRALKIPTWSTSCLIMIDDRVVAECGVAADNERQAVDRFAPQVVSFQTASAEFDIIVHISNYTYDRGGMWYAPHLGTDVAIGKLRENELAVGLILFGVFMFMGLYHLCIYLLRPQEKVALYFATGCMIGAIRLLFTGEMYILNFFPDISVGAVVVFLYSTYYGGVLVFTLYLRQMYPHEIPRITVRVTMWISALFLLTVIVTPTRISTHLIQYYHMFMLLLALSIITGIIVAVVRKREGARLQLFGTAMFMIAIFHDILYNMFYITGFFFETNALQLLQRQMMHFGLFVLVFVQAIVLARRFSKAFRTIETMSDKLVSLDRMKDEFMANTSHELQTPLHGIINMSQAMLEGSAGAMTQAQQANMSTIVSVARRLVNLIRDILDFSKLKNGEITLERRSVSLQGALRANLEVFRHYVGNKPIELTVNIPDHLPSVYADENRLVQILYNLIGNAIKFTNEGEIKVTADHIGNWVRVSVTDTGIGLSASQQEVIFQSFEQVSASVSREYGGTGLGLSITKQLVELNGGQITVNSMLGSGSTFSFTLPVSTMKEQRSPSSMDSRVPSLYEEAEAAAPSIRKHPNGSFTILAVDDDPTNLQVILNVLAQEPYRILIASGGEQALEMLKPHHAHSIDIVILDVMMPRISGYDVCRSIREQFTLFELPILLVTVKSEPEDMISGFAAGANDFLVKPFYSHELRGRVRTLLDMKRSVEQAIESEIAFLQAQIKPHFLYNALSTIIGICPRDPKKATDLLTDLSLYLRSSFDFRNRQQFVRLEVELQLVEAYLAIEQARFGERLRMIYDIDSAIECLIPPLSIQPLVENAVRHGIMKRMNGGTIKLSIRSMDDAVWITVEDDGVGMSPERLERLFDGESASSGVGLINIETRMRRFYGYGLQMESVADEGMRISMRIPLNGTEMLQEGTA
ncbi:ATP-binding protein [Paenibacillus koleovorans]|uniref:ATP-binding protein n=1 Tax=Paenibacillus koleovorans TaxID=121608 RepID=UPI000FD817A1|nr:ATP-binding protein [Paenibacillus koleovorans]